MYEKRGQFTIFVILGFVLVVAFAFLLFARSILFQDKLQLEAQITVDEAVKSSHIDTYVESCLDRVADEAIYLMGLQGGVLYKSQGGTIPDPMNVGNGSIFVNVTDPYNNSDYGFLNVSYAIIPNFNTSCLNITPPFYPFYNEKLAGIYGAYNAMNCNSETGAFGEYNLTKICNPNGTNRFNASGMNEFSCGNDYRFYEDESNNMSIQEQLEVYISNKTKLCVNFSIFENIGYNISIIDKPNTTVIYGLEGLTVGIVYPFKVKIKGESRIAFAKFEVKKNIFLMEIYNYIYSLLNAEYTNISFDIDTYYKISTEFKQEFNLLRIDDPCINNCTAGHGKYDNLFIFTDNRSEIWGKPLIFNIVIKNRAPVLELISAENALYNIVVLEGDEIKITPYGKDPDETPLPEQLSYNYSDWKENYDVWFNESCCNTISCTLDTIESCMVYNASFNWTCCASNSACLTDPSVCVVFNSDSPHNWTLSNDYTINNNHMNASYKTNRYDLGLHYTVVSVKDEEGLYDFQNVSIMVYDIPITIPNGSNDYEDISYKNASIEDRYNLYAYKYSIATSILEFKWNDTIEPFNITTPHNLTIVPDNLTTNGINIENIGAYVFIKFNATLNESIHNITLSGKFTNPSTSATFWTVPNIFEVEVHQCLPHKNDSAPYPYNNWSNDDPYNSYIDSIDPFMANHTCCDDGSLGFGWGNVSKGNLCYDYTDYGINKTIKLDEFNWGNYNPSINSNWNHYLLINVNITNDILKRTFNRTCDGSRGNICNGTAVQNVTVFDSCADFSLTIRDERCSGPPIELITTTNESEQHCTNYTNTTFEKLFGYGGTGSCNQQSTCSNLGSGGYNVVGGEQWCNATCNGVGGCNSTTTSTCIDCRIDKVASDDDGGNNSSLMGNCTGGENGTCSNSGGGCISQQNGGIHKDYFNTSTCPGLNCQLIEYYPANTHPDPNSIEETCASTIYFTKSDKGACEAYNATWVVSFSEPKQCCGDANDEVIKYNPGSNISPSGCCKNNECGYNNSCKNANIQITHQGQTYECKLLGPIANWTPVP